MANEDEQGTRRSGLERREGRLFYAGRELPEGTWHRETDRAEFEANGFACLLQRGPLGAWCGYVAVPPEHPWHGKAYGEIEPSPDVHGGLTYAHECAGTICHIPKPGESDNVWWLGFDCAHLGDLIPGMLAITPERYRSEGEGYKTAAYVRHETAKLAEQANAATSSGGIEFDVGGES